MDVAACNISWFWMANLLSGSHTGFIKSHLRVSDVVTLYDLGMLSFFSMGIKRACRTWKNGSVNQIERNRPNV